MDEIIYIPDDDDDDEILHGRRSRRRSSTASEVEYISTPPPHRRHQVADNGNIYDAPARQPGERDAPGPAVTGEHLQPQNSPQNENFMDDIDFDWNRFVHDNEGGEGAGLDGMNAGADYNVMFGFDQGRFDIPVLPVDPAQRRVSCVDEVVALFPNICKDFVFTLYDEGVGQLAEQLIVRILDDIEKGKEYPKAKDKLKTLKRKREIDPEEEEEKNYASADRQSSGVDYATITRQILSGEFSDTPMVFIDATLDRTNHLLFPSYRVLEEAERTWSAANPPYNKIKSRRKANRFYSHEEAEKALKSEATTLPLMEALREVQTARRVRRKAEEKRQEERLAEREEEENVARAIADGTMTECGCCVMEYPLNRMVHCENEAKLHAFCRSCAKQTAENEIGLQKYEIKCMSMDGCGAGFSRHEKTVFLNEASLIALDRNEQEAMLRLAGIENLESCPFCPFAAEYPPIEVNKEFRCQSEDCEKVSCRLCRLESHIPKTCEESAKDNGLSIRRQIEEAMSAALIRKCNKCGTPFVKEEGCNKMTCTRSGCMNVQCYVCSKSCTYDHFNDRSRGGKPGNCPLFESVEQRHEEEVSKAEKAAMDKVRAEHPEYTEDDLKVKVSESVRKDEERRKAIDPRNMGPVIQRGGQAIGNMRPPHHILDEYQFEMERIEHIRQRANEAREGGAEFPMPAGWEDDLIHAEELEMMLGIGREGGMMPDEIMEIFRQHAPVGPRRAPRGAAAQGDQNAPQDPRGARPQILGGNQQMIPNEALQIEAQLVRRNQGGRRPDGAMRGEQMLARNRVNPLGAGALEFLVPAHRVLDHPEAQAQPLAPADKNAPPHQVENAPQAIPAQVVDIRRRRQARGVPHHQLIPPVPGVPPMAPVAPAHLRLPMIRLPRPPRLPPHNNGNGPIWIPPRIDE